MTYRANYDFTSEHNHKNILSFKSGDLFVLIQRDARKTLDHHGWIYVANEDLKHGYVPATYVALCEEKDENIIRFNQTLIPKLEVARKTGCNEQELKRYEKLLKQLQSSLSDLELPPDTILNDSPIQNQDDYESATFTPVSQPTPDISIPKDPKDACESSNSTIPELFGCDLLEHVKHNTGLGYKQVRMAVESTLEFLANHLRHFQPTSEAILQSINGSSPSGEALENIHDWQRLNYIFCSILAVKTDVEQLNWALHEDQHIISGFLEELINIFTDGDPVVCKLFLKRDQYNNVEALVQYFQMETRINIRQLLLKVFKALCSLDRQCITVLLNTDLPLLLAKDILNSKEDIAKLIQSCSILTMLMWTGEDMPVNHYEILNVDFVNNLLEVMDDLSSDEETEKITNFGTELLLAFNLQFSEPSSNIVLRALESRSTAKEFLEKIIMLANREDDPVGVLFDHTEPPPNAVHKMLLDIFSQSQTSNLFYTNDLKVLIEIIARKIMDLSPDDELQTVYLRLANNVICNTEYSEHRHCANEFQECFQKILQEDSGSPEINRILVATLIEKYPDIFSE